MTTLEWVLILVAAGAVIVTLAVGFLVARRRLGRPIQRPLERGATPLGRSNAQMARDARPELLDAPERTEPLRQIPIRHLSADERRDFHQRWGTVQQRFIDNPEAALREAHELVLELLAARGYPDVALEDQIENVAAHHPHIADHFREAVHIARSARASRASTEELRQATIHYRALFDDLLEESTSAVARDARASTSAPLQQGRT
jgi:hypothetical protein